MKLDRRSFLGFALGAGAGVTLSPLPWKITDDLAIWTQNWPWTPVPPRGPVSYENTVCNLCPGGCGISVTKVDDRAIKIEGREGYPINDGGLCLLGAAGLQLLYYGGWRAQSPLRRAGKRGEGQWEAITWDQAMDTVVQKLGELRNSGSPHKVACLIDSDRGTVARLFARFMNAYGSPNLISSSCADDTSEIVVELMQGVKAPIGYDLKGADFILSFGCGLIEGWGSPVRSIQAHSHWKSAQGPNPLVQAEPRLSTTAAKADTWYPIKPGTEAALALGVAHVIIQEGLYDKTFVADHSFGFEDWNDGGKARMGFKQLVVSEYSPGAVAEVTGISADRIAELAKAFANAKHPVAVWGRGKGNTPGSAYECMAVYALNALVGNINKDGGARPRPDVQMNAWPEVELDAPASAGLGQPRIDGAGAYPLAKSLFDKWPEGAGSLEVLLLYGGDPHYTMLNNAAAAKAFEDIPFIVSFGPYLDDSAQHADLILPNHAYLERWEDFPTPRTMDKPVLGLIKPVVKPQFNTRHVGDVVMAIAGKLGGSVAQAFPWQDYESLLKETIGDKWDQLAEQGYVTDADYTPPAWGDAFKTASGKFEFAVSAVAKTGKAEKDTDFLPHYEPIRPEGDSSSYPLILIPSELMRLSYGAIGNPPFCTKTLEENELKKDDLFVEVNPLTAGDYGLAEGKFAILETPKGEAKVLVHLYEGIRPGLIAIPKGLGHSGYDEFLAGKGVNANRLMSVAEDPLSGLTAAWGIQAKLTSA